MVRWIISFLLLLTTNSTGYARLSFPFFVLSYAYGVMVVRVDGIDEIYLDRKGGMNEGSSEVN